MKTLKLLLAVIVLFTAACSSKSGKRVSERLDSTLNQNSKLKKENVELRKLLVAHLTSLCDTESVETKLKRQQYADFETAAITQKNKLETALSKKKNIDELAASKVKSDMDTKSYMDNSKSVMEVYKEWDRNEHQSFTQYVTLKFYEDEGDYYNTWKKITALEKSGNPAVVKAFRLKHLLDSTKQVHDNATTKLYTTATQTIQKKYSDGMQKIQQDFDLKCTNKRKELGLQPLREYTLKK